MPAFAELLDDRGSATSVCPIIPPLRRQSSSVRVASSGGTPAAHADAPERGRHHRRREASARRSAAPRRNVPFLLARSSSTHLAAVDHDPGVAPGDGGRLQPDHALLHPPEQVLARVQRDLAVLEHQPIGGRAGGRAGRGPDSVACAAEREADAVHRPQEAAARRASSSRAARTSATTRGQRRLRDERAGPEPVADPLAGDDVGPLVEQQLQQLEGLGAEAALLVARAGAGGSRGRGRSRRTHAHRRHPDEKPRSVRGLPDSSRRIFSATGRTVADEGSLGRSSG